MNYDKFVRTYNGPSMQAKGDWPYEWLEDIGQLDQDHLPPADAFYSTLRGANTLGRDAAEIQVNYERLQTMWKEKKWRTMRDMLVHYSTQDVVPFVCALSQMQNYYR